VLTETDRFQHIKTTDKFKLITVVKSAMNNIEKEYDEWCEVIANSRDAEDLIAHFRQHVSDHYERHQWEGDDSVKVWLVGVLNFMHIFEKKFPGIKTDDLLYKLCRHYKHAGGPHASFDVDEFVLNYKGDIKEFYEKNRTKSIALIK